MKVVIIGSGNVAESLARAVRESENTLVQVFARNKERGSIVAEIGGTEWCGTPEQLAKAEGEKGAEFVSIFYGEDVTEEQAQRAQEIFAAACPDAEVSVLPGGQPVYYYMISVE